MSGERAPANRSIRSDRVPAARERDEVPGHGVREAGGGGSDRFRIKIIDTTTNTLVYDNVGGSDDLNVTNPQMIQGGSIVIHSK